tara:strand:- start:21 stop:851 length:831 start_codon:yes stop_codon:yes gene_type:complete
MEIYNKRDYCNNCGNYGHLYKNCRHPILSYGIILYHISNESRIVMVERKDTLSYIEFLRGKYTSINNIDYLKLLFSRFSQKELQRIGELSFDDLWNDLWIHTETVNSRIKKEYKKSKDNFYKLKKGYYLKEELINIDYLINSVTKPYQSNEWEIPKGRRKPLENNRECAIREFNEETNIKPDSYQLYSNIIPIIEEYTGINGVRYKHVYYIGFIDKQCDLKINMDNKDQYTEIKDIKWCSKKECIEKVRDYDTSKLSLINKFFNYLENYKKVVVIE